MNDLILDLFSGLGGWTQAFMNNEKYDVHRYDSDPWLADIDNTNILDLSRHKVGSVKPLKLLIGSPPCYEFSEAYDAPRVRARRNGEPFTPSMDLIEAFIEHRDRMKPEWWLMENVKGSIPDITPILGEPRQIIGPFVLWGNFPLLDISESELKLIKKHKRQAGDKYRWSEHRSSYRAFIPMPMSAAIKRSIESPTLLRWS